MKKNQVLLLWLQIPLTALTLLLAACSDRPQADFGPNIISSDIDNFWTAYDKVVRTTDTTVQYQYLKEFFFDRGTPGLVGIMKARRYTAREYLQTINDYPLFWKSMRANTLKARQIGKELEDGIQKLKALYPELKPAKIYLTIGALRTNGTVMDSMLLIGTELAMGDSNVVTTEFPKMLSHLPAFFKNNPIQNVVALNIHEYIHTQQNAIGGYDLLSQSVFEGVAEFVPTIALKRKSSTAAITYGMANDKKVKARFSEELFSPWIYNWIWNSPENEFGIRDLGYYAAVHILAFLSSSIRSLAKRSRKKTPCCSPCLRASVLKKSQNGNCWLLCRLRYSQEILRSIEG